jgi:diguanylate cyclase (GGDEF)-like protein/PAS domain S-box-containing protein
VGILLWIVGDGEVVVAEGLTRTIVKKDHWRTFFAAAPAGLAILDPDLRYVQVNDALAKINGQSPDAHKGKTLQDVAPAFASVIEPLIRRVLATGIPLLDQEVTGDPPGHQGGPRHWVVSFFPLHENGSQAVAGVGTITFDITDRKSAEEKLARSLSDERRFRALIESSSDAIAILDTSGAVLYASPTTARILGYEPGEFTGGIGFDLLHPRDRDGIETLFAQLAQEPGGRITAEARVRHKNGTWRWVEAIGTNLLAEPTVQAIVINYRDITERKMAEEALREANDKLTYWARELERHNKELSLLREMGELLQACQNSDEAYHIITRSARELFTDCSGAVYMVNQAKTLAEAVAEWGQTPPTDDIFTRDDCWALRLGRVHMSQDGELVCRHLGHPAPPASLCVPMVGQGETLGVLHMRFAAPDSQTVQAHRRLASTFAERIVLALDNLKLRENLRAQSIRDPLTGLFNRRYMEESLDRELRRAERLHQPVSVIVFDLDHFKEINDSFGHEMGDVVLASFGDFLQNSVRKGDIACRYGGEEFLLILPGASREDAVARAHQLREVSGHLAISHRGKALGPVTLSLGVAVFPDHGSSGGTLLRAADQALYRAKHLGRDRVEIAP